MKIDKFFNNGKNLSLKSKILIYVIAVIVVCLSIFYILFNKKNEDVIINNSILQTKKTAQQTCEYLQYRLYSIQMQFNYMETNKRLIKISSDESPSLEDKEYIYKLIDNVMDSDQNFIDNVFLCSKNNTIYHKKMKIFNDNIPVTERAWYKIADNNIGRTVWAINLNDETFENISATNKIHLIKSIRNENDCVVGKIVFELNENAIRNFIRNIKMDDDSLVLILDNDGNLVSSSGEYSEHYINSIKSKIKGEYGFTETNSTIVTYDTIKINNWKLLYVISKKSLTSPLSSIKTFMMYIFLFVLLMAFVVTKVISALVTMPIYKFINMITEIKNGNFNVRFNSKTCDEIGIMGNVFDDMCSKITSLIDEVVKERELKNYSELKVLQEQIKAHFLYNTLDTIYWIAKSGDVEKTSEMISSLANMFRLALNDGKEVISVRNEIEYLKKYIYIESVRKGKSFMFDINMSEEILDYNIPKMILQPLVENAIVHGVYANKKGKILIRGFETEDKIIFEVSDDGGKLDVNKMNEILSETEIDKNNKGYALHNLKTRLELIFHHKYMLEYECVPNKVSIFRIEFAKYELLENEKEKTENEKI